MKRPYSDIYLLPLPKKNLAKYKKIASAFGKMARQYGATGYREFIGDDVFPKGVVSLAKGIRVGKGEVLIAAVVDFKSRAHRDAVYKKMFKDPRMQKMAEKSRKNPLMDDKKMAFGGFKTIVDV